MKKILCLFSTLILVLVSSCSNDDKKDDSSSGQFEFLEFDKDVLLPSINAHDITFLATGFDKNLKNWELTLTDQTGNIMPAQLSEVKDTGASYPVGNSMVPIQRIAFNAHPKEDGVYTLIVKNKITGQTFTDSFLVGSKTFNKMQYYDVVSYDIIAGWNSTEPEPTHNYIYYQNVINTIYSKDVATTGIASIRLEDRSTFKKYDLDFSVNAIYNQIQFKIPSSVPRGKYFLSVRYNNLLSNYFEKDIVVETEKIPILNSINKNTFKGGETLTLKGASFWYKINPDLLPGSLFQTRKATSKLFFTNKAGADREYELSSNESDPSFKYMNAEGTEINYPLPLDPIKDGTYLISDSKATYFEGTVSIKTGPYESAAMPIRIDYK
jgi:hypothetical protein